MHRQIALVLGVALFLAIAYASARVLPSGGDVGLYRRYALRYSGPARELPREYPPLSVFIFLLPQKISPQYYQLTFASLTAAMTAVVVVVIDKLNRRGWWLVWYLVLGAFGTLFFRYDIFVVALTVSAFLAATRQRWVAAQALLALGVSLKLYPLILMPLVVIGEWRVERRYPWRSGTAGALALLATVGSMWLLAPAGVTAMLHYHQQRPLEFESVGASIAWVLGNTTPEFSFGSWNLRSPAEALLIRMMTVFGVLLLVAVYAYFWRERLSPARAWAVTLIALLTTSKVFSTQYLIWLLPFIVLIEDAAVDGDRNSPPSVSQRASYRRLWLVVCLLSTLVYPVGLASHGMPDVVARSRSTWLMAAATVRNVLMIGAGLLLLDIRRPRLSWKRS